MSVSISIYQLFESLFDCLAFSYSISCESLNQSVASQLLHHLEVTYLISHKTIILSVESTSFC